MARPPAAGKPRKPTKAQQAKQAAVKGEVPVGSNALIDRYGFIHRIVYSPDAKSKAALIAEGKAWLVGVGRAQASVTVSHPGIPRIKRGDSIRLAMPGSENGVPVGDTMVIKDFWVTEAHFSLTPGAFDMELILGTEDPFLGDPVVDKLTDTADSTGRVPPLGPKKKKPKPKSPHYKHKDEPSSKSGGAGDPAPPTLAGAGT
jgi:hypothetical protein